MKARFFLALAALLPGAVCSAQDYSQLKLDETHLLLNAYATPEELASPYVAATLQTLGELSADRRTLTLPAGTTVYIAPGVYWTDETYRQGFPFDDSGFVIAPPNVGLTILGDNISFIGLSGDPEDVRIAGNRGEGGAKGLGAGGSWYTLAVSTGFRAETSPSPTTRRKTLSICPIRRRTSPSASTRRTTPRCFRALRATSTGWSSATSASSASST